MFVAHSSKVIANFFIQKGLDDGVSVSNLKVQKMVYIAHGYHLGFFNKPLFYEQVKAWTFGPVIPELYEELRHYGKTPITACLVNSNPGPIVDKGDVLTKELLEKVWDGYKKASAGQLVSLTHQSGTPWHTTFVLRGNEFMVIDNDLIRHYYEDRIEKAA